MCILMSFFSRFYAVSFYDLRSLGNFIVDIIGLILFEIFFLLSVINKMIIN